MREMMADVKLTMYLMHSRFLTEATASGRERQAKLRKRRKG